ncbi:MAG: hypothetical protein JRI85_14365 [Deltaproteobacteria bacterium]|nr:hypothetical protein [Deltaproteobacteria bacterium]
MTYSLDLRFRKPGEDDPPFSPIADIYVKAYTQEKDEHILITPECVTVKELKYEIDRLKKELDDIGKKAEQKFKASKK